MSEAKEEVKVTQVEVKVDDVVEEIQKVQQETIETIKQVEQVVEQVEQVTDKVKSIYDTIKQAFTGQTNLPAVVLKVMTEVEKCIPASEKQKVAIEVIKMVLPDSDPALVLALIDAFVICSKSPSAIQSKNNQSDKSPQGCCSLM